MTDLTQRIANLPPEKRARLEERLLAARKKKQQPSIPRREDDGATPLSFGQERLWFMHQIHAHSTFYNEQSSLRLTGILDEVAFKNALTEIFQRHEILHTAYRLEDEQLRQVVQTDWELPLQKVDLQSMPKAAQDGAITKAMHRDIETAFNLSIGQVKRFLLLQTKADEHILVHTSHHIASDFWSSQIFWREFATLYQAFSKGQASPLSDPPLQYADYASWQRKQIDTARAQAQLAYWQARLADPPVVVLPTDYQRPTVPSGQGREITVTLPSKPLQELYDLGRRKNATAYASLLALFNVLIARFTNQYDICIGTSVLGRPREELFQVIGFFINNLILRNAFSPDASFQDVLEISRETASGALANQDYPFDQLLAELHLTRDLSRNPLAQIRFTMLETQFTASTEIDTLHIQRIPRVSERARYDLNLRIIERGSETQAIFSYNTDIFSQDLIAQLAASFCHLLEAVVINPDQPISQLSLQTAAMDRKIVKTWNKTQVAFPIARAFPDLFAEHAIDNADQLVAVDLMGSYTWRELQTNTDQLADRLREAGVISGDIVALLGHRNRDFLTGLLAILQLGAVYLPLDPRNPVARHRQMIQHSKCRYLLVASDFAETGEAIIQDSAGQILILDQLERNPLDQLPLTNEIQPSDIAYLLYTSGSTGQPKGALIEHRGMLNHLYAKIHDLELSSADRIAQTAPQSFDISVWQFLVALLCDGRVYIYPDEIALDPKRLLRQIQQDEITVLEVVPTLLRAMLEALEDNTPLPLPNLRWLIPTGEALSPELCNRWLALYPDVPLLNAYGPTECSDDVTHHIIRHPLPQTALRTPIGRPIANMQAYILDAQRRICPVGKVGELWIGGVGVGPGYLNEPEQTAIAFHPDPYRSDPDARLYHTGDLARYQADGTIEFFGRADYQVKIRGARVELEEVEAQLLTHPAIEDGVIIFEKAQDAQVEGMLIAFVLLASDKQLTPASLLTYLRQRLPEHMVPTGVEFLEAFPVTPNGKVDRLRLAEIVQNETATEAEAPTEPCSPLETLLLEVWQQVLKQDQISIQDDFFSLGGDSIRAAIVINELQKRLNEIIYVVAIFDAPTIAQLADYLMQRYPASVQHLLDTPTHTVDADMPLIDETTVAAFRRLIPQVGPSQLSPKPRNPSAIFILSAPRSGSTLFRIMLAGHPDLFSPPELDLLGFADMAQRRTDLGGRWRFRQEGLLRAVMALHQCDAEEAIRLVGAYEDNALPVHEFYRLMQDWLGTRRLVDKTPIYALDPTTLQRAETEFDQPLYIHLLRHPLGMINSFEQARTDQVFLRQAHNYAPRTLAELVWLVSHQNIQAFLKTIPEVRQTRIHFEQLVTDPKSEMQKLADLLELDLSPQMLDPYRGEIDRMTDGLYPISRMLGDVKFHTYRQINPDVATRWQETVADYRLSDLTWQQAEEFGYNKPTIKFKSSATKQAKPIINKAEIVMRLIHAEGSKPPLFFIPGGGGSEWEFLIYDQLFYLLGEDQPVYGFYARGLEDGQPPHTNVTQMVTDYLQALHAVQPQGPYFIGGECTGGKVAFEMARQLQAQGQKVVLFLLNTGLTQASADPVRNLQRQLRYKKHIRQVQRHMYYLQPLSFKHRLGYIGEKLHNLQVRFFPLTAEHRRQRRIRQVQLNYSQLLQRYRLKHPYPGDLVLIVSESDYQESTFAGWKDWVDGTINFHPVPGIRKSYLVQHVETTAVKLNACLVAARHDLLS